MEVFLGLLAVLWLLLVLAGLLCLVIGLVNPGWILRWSAEDEQTRRAVIKKIGGTTLALFIGVPIFTLILESAILKDPEEEYYTANREDILTRVDSLLAEGDSEVALDTTSRYIDYATEGSRLDSLHNVARADTLYKNVLQIPASEVEKNREMYKRLKELDPGNEFYRRKLSHYTKLSEQKQRKKTAKRQKTATERSISEENFHVAYEDVVDTRIKAQIEQRVYVSGETSKGELRKFVKNRHNELASRSGFTYYDHPTNVYVYVFESEEHADRGGSGWMVASMKGASDKEPRVQINSGVIKAYLRGPEKKFGFSEPKRKEIFRDIVKAEDRAAKEAREKYPNDVDQETRLERELARKFKEQVRDKYDISESIEDSITTEALSEGWSMPSLPD